MYNDLKNKVAVVTGGSKGLGTAIAKRYADEGMAVVVNYHTDREGAMDVVDYARSVGARAEAVQADVSTEDGVIRLLDTAVDRFGGLDVWVNNAGLENQVPTHELSLEDWNRVLSVNLTGVFLGAKHALSHFLKHKVRGNILNMSSVHEIVPWPTFAHYAASKAAVGMFTKTVAMEYASRGIRINAIGPGAINTPINAEKFADPEQYRQTAEMIPMKRIGESDEVAAAAAWLVSDQATYVTGVTLFIDGGMTLHTSFQDGKG